MKQYEWNRLSAPERRNLLSRPALASDAKQQARVAEIVELVRREGDAALRRLTLELDGIEVESFQASEDEFEQAEAALTPTQRQAIRAAAANIETFHRAQQPSAISVETAPGVRCERVSRPIQRVGLYVPAGTAPLPSTALMLGIPARLAGCDTRILCSPVQRNGGVDAAVLYAARVSGVETVFKISGAQAVAAMAYGTETVPKVDKIFGPGNTWVTAAKALVDRDPAGAARDFPAGPSEVMVIADHRANAAFVASDLLSQAEHGIDSQVLLLTTSREIGAAVSEQVELQTKRLTRREIVDGALAHSSIIFVENLETAFDIANDYAPEHLILQVEQPRVWLDVVQAAGSVFLGPWAPESVGDYCSGTNHVLPTYGYARRHSSLGLADFYRSMTVQELTEEGLLNIGPIAETLAELEGLDAHARAVSERLELLRAPECIVSSVLDLARPDLRKLRPYVPGAYEPGLVRLNANESPWRAPGDTTERGLNIYPPPRPFSLRDRLAEHYGARQQDVLVTRGSSEAIDVLIRGFCRAGQDKILICPPTFDMYRLYAGIQGAEVVTVPLRRANGFELDSAALLDAVDASVKIVFICTPNNPTGQSVPRAEIESICAALAGRALVVIDEAYHEFADADDCLDLQQRYEHVVLLRTLSKFVSLAGVRCGVVIAATELVEFLGNVLPPYTFPTPSIELVLQALTKDSLHVSQERVTLLKRERARLADALLGVPEVIEVYPSDANFILVKTRNGRRFRDVAHKSGILVRLFANDPALADCVRITVGRPNDNDRLLKALSGVEQFNGA